MAGMSTPTAGFCAGIPKVEVPSFFFSHLFFFFHYPLLRFQTSFFSYLVSGDVSVPFHRIGYFSLRIFETFGRVDA